MYRRNWRADVGPTTVGKMNRCSCVGVGKDPGQNSVIWNVHSWHSGDNWSRDTDGFLLSHGKFSGSRVMDLFRHLRVDPPWNNSEDLVEIARGEFKEAQGASERPCVIEYLSVHCDISPLIFGSSLEAQKVPVIRQAIHVLTLTEKLLEVKALNAHKAVLVLVGLDIG